jgi:Zn-dependent M28 family amino/carboxypeptidase
VTLRVSVDGFINEDVITYNVIADSPGGRTDRTVVVGGHLDSVYEGPGINDDGSGVGMMLETAQEMAELGIEPVNHLRFIYFSGEEQGLLGSEYYVSQLTAAELRDISVMLDYDMLASGNYARFVYDGDGSDHDIAGPNGSGSIERVFADYFDSQGLAFETIPFDGRSDYDAFTTAGIPAGGIFSGAEAPKTEQQEEWYGGDAGAWLDPCYHQACDTIANLSAKSLDELGDAAAHATLTLTKSKAGLFPDGSRKAAKAQAFKAQTKVNKGHAALR